MFSKSTALKWLFVALLTPPAISFNFSVPNIAATFQETPRPFTLQVDPSFIIDTRQKAANAREPLGVEGADTDGPGLANFTNIRDYWANTYDWNATQASINKNLKQYTTIVRPKNSTYNDSVALHFVHHRSPRSDAIPLLFVHGWPGSFLEVSHIIANLTNPPNASLPAFHVVAPSIPGFAFSPSPSHVGFGPIEAAHAFDALMQQLNYTHYVAQGGDFGSFILHYQANLYPTTLRSFLSNFWPIPPSASDYTNLALNVSTPDERAYIARYTNYVVNLSGYRYIQQTFPLTVAYAMTDSPVGLAIWFYSLMSTTVDPADFAWTLDEIITWTMMHYIQGPYGAMRLYKEAMREGTLEGFDVGTLPQISQPTAISEFPYDLWYRLPLEWAQREGNVKVRFLNSKGGHFAAYEVPEVLLGNLWQWFGERQLSGIEGF